MEEREPKRVARDQRRPTDLARLERDDVPLGAEHVERTLLRLEQVEQHRAVLGVLNEPVVLEEVDRVGRALAEERLLREFDLRVAAHASGVTDVYNSQNCCSRGHGAVSVNVIDNAIAAASIAATRAAPHGIAAFDWLFFHHSYSFVIFHFGFFTE